MEIRYTCKLLMRMPYNLMIHSVKLCLLSMTQRSNFIMMQAGRHSKTLKSCDHPALNSIMSNTVCSAFGCHCTVY